MNTAAVQFLASLLVVVVLQPVQPVPVVSSEAVVIFNHASGLFLAPNPSRSGVVEANAAPYDPAAHFYPIFSSGAVKFESVLQPGHYLLFNEIGSLVVDSLDGSSTAGESGDPLHLWEILFVGGPVDVAFRVVSDGAECYLAFDSDGVLLPDHCQLDATHYYSTFHTLVVASTYLN